MRRRRPRRRLRRLLRRVAFSALVITDREPTPQERAKFARSERLYCVAAASFALIFGVIGIVEIARKGNMEVFGYVQVVIGIGWLLVFYRSLRRYREMAGAAL